MNGLSLSWKIFRIVCIVQMVLIAFQWMLSISGLFFSKNLLYPFSEGIVYGLIFLFVYMGLSLLNDNYPDTPLTDRQRRRFNWLFLLNVLFVAYLFGQFITVWRMTEPYLEAMHNASFSDYLSLLVFPLFALIIFSLHVVFLGGMFRLRREIYRNTVDQWYHQFGEERKK